METRRKVRGPEHPDTLTSMNNLASTYRNQGRWTEAEELEVQVMETRRRVLSPEHPDTLTSMNNLASTYRNQGRWAEAEVARRTKSQGVSAIRRTGPRIPLIIAPNTGSPVLSLTHPLAKNSRPIPTTAYGASSMPTRPPCRRPNKSSRTAVPGRTLS